MDVSSADDVSEFQVWRLIASFRGCRGRRSLDVTAGEVVGVFVKEGGFFYNLVGSCFGSILLFFRLLFWSPFFLGYYIHLATRSRAFPDPPGVLV
jgi:hypothetical protein